MKDENHRSMQFDHDFSTAYRELNERMKHLAESDGDVYVPNPEPASPVQHVMVCMEPSMGRWARSPADARAKVEAGFRNFLYSIEDFILHMAARRYLCGAAQNYYITDFSKGAMLVERANLARTERFSRWYGLLREEIELVSTADSDIVAVGMAVANQLELHHFQRPFTRVIHYSGQAAAARNACILGWEDDFRTFSESVSLADVISTAKSVLDACDYPGEFSQPTMARLARSDFSISRKKLLFNYKIAFEAIDS